MRIFAFQACSGQRIVLIDLGCKLHGSYFWTIVG